MGTLRTSFAWLAAALTVGLVSGLPHVTLANDVGPGKEVRAVRGQFGTLVRGRSWDPDLRISTLAIDDVTVDRAASVRWHTETVACSSSLVRLLDRWWLDKTECTPAQHENGSRITLERYQVALAFPKQGQVSLTDLLGRAPTEAESWVTRGGNSYFFFSGTVQADAPVHIDAGTTIDVWFPFELDRQLHYGITIAHAAKPIGPIDGTLKDNVLHFVLPAFDVAPGARLMGEIEGDDWPHYAGP